ncbi:MAG: ActS/PrrB/RegB family redox-sensitive histidine kinase [Alphaproteobacteria bacterium]
MSAGPDTQAGIGTEFDKYGGAQVVGAPGALLGMTGRVGLRPLTLIRWVAIAGQATALLVVHYGLGFDLPIVPAFAVVGASVALNVLIAVRRPARGRLKETEAALHLAFDVLQLAVLLYLTGGLTNPFALLIVAPVTVSATLLSRRSTIALCGLAIGCATVLAVWHQPLPLEQVGFEPPPLLVAGTWTAVVIGTVFLAVYTGSVSEERRRMHDALSATQLALAREQRLSSLGALAAATAHELGSPLATIAVTANELAKEIPSGTPLADDVTILRSESERCREILAELGQRSEASGDDPYSVLPLSVLVETAAEPHRQEGAELKLRFTPLDDSAEPVVRRSPELMHGLGNIIQNAVQFSRRDVTVTTGWNDRMVTLAVRDDGPGFPPAVLDRIGEPYVSSRQRVDGHLGLGIFIAQTLLEQTGAGLSFGNGRKGGAEVAVFWPRDRLEARGSTPETVA